jgi:hypothetical protein
MHRCLLEREMEANAGIDFLGPKEIGSVGCLIDCCTLKYYYSSY